MGAADHHLLGDHAVDELAPRLHRERAVLIVGTLPIRMRGEQRRHVGRIVGDHQLLAAAADVERRMARRVAGRVDETDAGGNFLLRSVFPVTGDAARVAAFEVSFTTPAGSATSGRIPIP